ncbi:MAG TPA: bifunctional riboflavin kinase/FAD synthetase [Microvirga sp.]|jgi:riboflavin kinase/FMN adenylyltransferase|nr:bifunctional riboflavin kinase/FAD synthetase [Microvirga sp.]
MPPFALCLNDEPVPPALQGAVVAIGNFDGVHRGHRRLVEAARERALQLGRPAAVLTFEPHPRLFFQPDAPLFRLTPEPVKLALLRAQGLAGAFVRGFDAALAALSAEGFVTDLLVRRMGISGVVVGYDFHFGRGREGNPGRLEALSQEHGLSCTVVNVVAEHGVTVSSTAIRAALEQGDVAAANGLLGYRWFVRAEVRHGHKRGRDLGYPTANLRLADDTRLRHGIYAVRARVGDRVHDGVASFGRRPTFDNGAPLLEAYLFDFAGDLYGQELDVEFVAWIRGEERFESIEALVARMDRDAEEARGLLAEDPVRSMISVL